MIRSSPEAILDSGELVPLVRIGRFCAFRFCFFLRRKVFGVGADRSLHLAAVGPGGHFVGRFCWRRPHKPGGRTPMWGTSDEIHRTVKDSGVGFDREKAKASLGIGLILMEERLKLVNGTLSVDSQPKRGTTIHACVPVG